MYRSKEKKKLFEKEKKRSMNKMRNGQARMRKTRLNHFVTEKYFPFLTISLAPL